MQREQIDDLIVNLITIKEFSKQIHYSCIGFEAYSWHLLADRIQENIDEYVDRLKEYLLGIDERPLTSKEYLTGVINKLPEANSQDTIDNFIKLQNLLLETVQNINSTEIEKAGDNLISEIADNLRNSVGIINLLVSKKG